MQSQTKKVYIFLGIVILLAGLSGWFYSVTPFSYGLDVKGGIRLTLKIQYEKDPVKAAAQRKDIASIQSRTISLLENRISSNLGVTEGSVMGKGEDEFVIEIPDVKDIDKARSIITTTAKLYAYDATNVVTSKAGYRTYTSGDTVSDEKGTYVAFTSTAAPGKSLKPDDPEYARMISGWTKILEGDDLQKAYFETGASGNVQPHFQFSDKGANKMETWTRSVMSRGEMLAFVLDGKVLSIAPIKDNTILKSEAFIDGTFDPAYVKNLCTLLNAGSLPASLEETSSAQIDPTIGRTAFDQMVTAGMIAFGVIVLFLLAYYSFPGFVALLALILYVLFTATVMKVMHATLSLAGLAGFILSVGMAVDANILVFERMKEEMREGRELLTAVELGFKRAFPAILDSNACTIITSVVLSILGTGMVRGFATTLITGVLISLFTAVTCTRTFLMFLVNTGIGHNPKVYAMNRSWFGEKYEREAVTNPLKVMSKSKLYFMISIITIIPGVIFYFMGGIKPNVEFRGGIEAEFIQPLSSTITAGEIDSRLKAAGYNGSVVKVSTAGNSKLVSVTVEPKKLSETDSTKLKELQKADVEKSVGLNEKASSFQNVTATIQFETIRNALLAVVLSAAGIIIYLAFRFGIALGGFKNGFKFGASAIGALVHDIFVVLGIAAIFGYLLNWQVSSLFVTGMLTVIGFSVHDTIVIFDRIRENLRRPQAGEVFEHLCDRSVSQSFGRSINTSATVVVTLLILVLFGTPTIDLKFFCVTMLTGIISGTYSSIFNATPILWLWDKAVCKKHGENKGLVGEAIRESNVIRAAQISAQATPADSTSYGTVRRRKGVKEQARKNIDP